MNRVAVVTGVSRGLGAALAAALVARGQRVVGIGRSAPDALDAARFRLVRVDLADGAALHRSVHALFAELADEAPEAITVINNAAVAGPVGPVGALDVDAIGSAFDVNLEAPVLVADAFLRAFASRGGERRLINVSSGAAVQPIPGAGLYCIAKAGLEMLTSIVAAEQGATGIVAVTIRPGIIDTPMQQFMRAQPRERLPSVGMFQSFHDDRQLVAPEVTAGKIVERLVLAPVDNGRHYSYAEL